MFDKDEKSSVEEFLFAYSTYLKIMNDELSIAEDVEMVEDSVIEPTSTIPADNSLPELSRANIAIDNSNDHEQMESVICTEDERDFSLIEPACLSGRETLDSK